MGDGPYDFSDALRLAKAGNVVRRVAWPDGFVLTVEDRLVLARNRLGVPVNLVDVDLTALDWEVAPGSAHVPAAPGVAQMKDYRPRRRQVRRQRDKELIAIAQRILAALKELDNPCADPDCGEVACGWARELERVLKTVTDLDTPPPEGGSR